MGAALRTQPKTEKTFLDAENSVVRCGVACMEGWRPEMEDAHLVYLSDNENLFGVFDGHCGAEVSEYCSVHWPEMLRNQKAYPHDLETAMKQSFFSLDEALLNPEISGCFFKELAARTHSDKRKRHREPAMLQREVRAKLDEAQTKGGSLSLGEARELAEVMAQMEHKPDSSHNSRTKAGSTAICAVMCDRKLIVANAGDSRGVLCRANGQVFPLSIDHKPNDTVERERIYKANGWVCVNGRVNGMLGLSRAIGDFEFKTNKSLGPEDQAVTCNPDILSVDIKDDDEFFMLACDGIWDVLTNEEAVAFVREGLQRHEQVSKVVEELLQRCLAKSPEEMGTDNMSCLVCMFKAPQQIAEVRGEDGVNASSSSNGDTDTHETVALSPSVSASSGSGSA